MRRLLPLLLVLVLAGCDATSATSGISSGLRPDEDGWRGEAVEDAGHMPEVSLVDTEEREVALARETRGRPTLLFFGYTSCPDVCPIHLAAIAAGLEETGLTTQDVQVVFVSVDPARDSPERIGEWLPRFHDGFVGLTGDEATIEEALAALDLPEPTVDGEDPRGEGDLIGHPAQVIGFDAEGEARRVWPFGTRRADWVADLPRVAEEWA